MSWKPEVTTVNKVEKHPNADALDVITLYDDVIVISKLNEYKQGDLVSFLPLDTIPGNHPAFSFLGKDTSKRIKAKRLRGIFSTGLIVKAPEGFVEGQCIKDYYNLTRYIADFERSEYTKDGYSCSSGGQNEKNPKEFSIPYYDLENARKYSKLFNEGEEVVITEKIHGENFSMIHDGKELWCKSRNFYKRKSEDSKWWEFALANNMEQVLSKYPMLAFMGEYYGNVSGFRYDCNVTNGFVKRKVRIFDIYDVRENKFLHYDKLIEITSELGLEVAPELFRGKWTKLDDYKHLCEDSSKLNASCIMEGFVIKSLDRSNFDDKNRSRSILKYVSEKYSLSKYS